MSDTVMNLKNAAADVVTTKLVRIEVYIPSKDIADDADEYIISVNGRFLARLPHHRAERFNLVER